MKSLILVLGKLFLLFLSNFGYYSWIRRKSRMDISFLPIVTIGIQITVLFAAGILNFLPEMVLALCIGGVLLFIKDIYRKSWNSYREFFSVPYVFAAISFFGIMLFLRGNKFSFYDDFTHWATVVKSMIQQDRFPNGLDTEIMFQEYPPGSAIYIYYFCKLSAGTESFQMIAQAFMLVAAMMPIFSYVKKNKIFFLFFLLIFNEVILTYSIPVFSLRVDTLLPLFGMSLLLLIMSRRSGESSDAETGEYISLVYSVPLLISTVLIKNSGLFFLPVAGGMVALQMIQEKKFSYKTLLTYILLPLLALLLWKKHCLLVFEQPDFTKHAMTFSNYANQAAGKEIGDMWYICLSVIKYMVSNSHLLVIGAGILLVFLAVSAFDSARRKEFKKALAVVLFLYGTYILGMCGMYIFSMPLPEAKKVLSIERYTAAAYIAILYFIVVWIAKIVSDVSARKIKLLFCCASFLWMIVSWGKLSDFEMIHGKVGSPERQLLEDVIGNSKFAVEPRESYYIYGGDAESEDYLHFVGRYLFETRNITVDSEITEEDLERIQEQHYLIMLQPADPLLDQWISENYPEQHGNSVVDLTLQ